MNVPYFMPWITQKDKNAVLQALNQRWLTNGPILKKFEDKIRKFVKTRYAIGVSSATHALHLSLKVLGIGPNDEVLLPTLTFAATSQVANYCGAKPILVDVDARTFNLLPGDIEKKITKKTKAIIVVHYGGQSCDMDEILTIAKRKNLHVIEDCAHSLGSTYKGIHCGNMGDVGCFSFYPTKVITTGEGGMLVTNNRQIYHHTRLLRSHAMNTTPNEREIAAEWQYDIVDIGFNYRLDEIRSALGLSQLNRINTINKMRIRIAKKYDKELDKIKGISIPYRKSDRNHIYHLYTIKIEKNYHLTRDELFMKLHEKGVYTSVQYLPLHLMSFNKKHYGNKTQDFPNANLIKDQIISLPIFPQMSTRQIDFVISLLQ